MILIQLDPVVETTGDPPVPVAIPSPVTVEEWVEQGRINPQTVAQQPELLARQLNAAVARCQDWCMRSFLNQKLKAYYIADRRRSCSCGCAVSDAGGADIVLPRGGVASVESVTAGGVVIDSTGYVQEGNLIRLAAPASTAAVVWVSGFGPDAVWVPDAIKEGIYEYATNLFEYRLGERPGSGGFQSNQNPFLFMPTGVQDLLRPYQIEPQI